LVAGNDPVEAPGLETADELEEEQVLLAELLPPVPPTARAAE
jgi:hypothetical protein